MCKIFAPKTLCSHTIITLFNIICSDSLQIENVLRRKHEPLNDSQTGTNIHLHHGNCSVVVSAIRNDDVGKLLGCVSSSKIEISVRSSWNNCYCYAWNLEKESELFSWPGKAMEKKDGVFTIEIDSSLYPELLITKGGDGPQSVDLLASSFQNGGIYDLSSADYSRAYLVGKYR